MLAAPCLAYRSNVEQHRLSRLETPSRDAKEIDRRDREREREIERERERERLRGRGGQR